jgi:hypothetical protein
MQLLGPPPSRTRMERDAKKGQHAGRDAKKGQQACFLAATRAGSAARVLASVESTIEILSSLRLMWYKEEDTSSRHMRRRDAVIAASHGV